MDIYDQEILRLADSTADVLDESWGDIEPLFQMATKNGQPDPCSRCGCLTMIRGGSYTATTKELTAAIRADVRIPRWVDQLCEGWDSLSAEQRIEKLQPFAYWQRRLDVEIRGKTPATEPAPQPVTT